METETIIEVVAKDCDNLGHLNHVEAVRYLERARDDWYTQCGLYGPGGRMTDLAPVVVNVRYDYRGECFLEERLVVVTRPLSMGRTSFTLVHEVRKPDGSVAIDGDATSVIMDLVQRVIVPVPDCLARHLPPRTT